MEKSIEKNIISVDIVTAYYSYIEFVKEPVLLQNLNTPTIIT